MISCIILSHDKPNFINEAIESVLNQTYQDWEIILYDSGILYDKGFFNKYKDPRFKIYKSTETEQIRKKKTVASWCYNRIIESNLLSGELIVYLCDDDVYYCNAFETFASFVLESPEVQAMYASEDYGWVDQDGFSGIYGERRALHPAGKFCNGIKLDCVVDYLQLCHRKEVFNYLPKGEWWSESLAFKHHADGIFLEMVGLKTTIHPIDVKIGLNRRTIRSINIPIS